ncbi:hypothetical protein FPV67DRAFT_1777746 [Lyophyllum atratum]|nr:hypothetical protein FPV67DRAFT_1777746 [Lyophyllum atratum]
MTEARSFNQPATRGFRRDHLYRDLLRDIARDHPDTISQNFVHETTLSDILSLVRRKDHEGADTASKGASPESMEIDSGWVGILPEDDILRFGLSSPRSEVRYSHPASTQYSDVIALQLGPTAHQSLEDELDKAMLSMTEFFHAHVEWDSLGEEEQNHLAWILPEDIENYKDSIELDTIRARSEQISSFQSGLSSVVSTYPPEINSRRGASNELFSARIEASLIKLSLIRARATQALYDHKTPKHPDTTIAQALCAAYAKLKADARKMNEEEAALDRQLAEYEAMLKLVDGGGGFTQVIEDWTRVQKEREECIRDLRRLGWTGD